MLARFAAVALLLVSTEARAASIVLRDEPTGVEIALEAAQVCGLAPSQASDACPPLGSTSQTSSVVLVDPTLRLVVDVRGDAARNHGEWTTVEARAFHESLRRSAHDRRARGIAVVVEPLVARRIAGVQVFTVRSEARHPTAHEPLVETVAAVIADEGVVTLRFTHRLSHDEAAQRKIETVLASVRAKKARSAPARLLRSLGTLVAGVPLVALAALVFRRRHEAKP